MIQRETTPTTIDRSLHPSKFELAVGELFSKATKAIISPIIHIFTYRARQKRASEQRQAQLSAFWQSEQRRLWPMLQGRFDKQPDWDRLDQILFQAEMGMVRASEAAELLKKGLIGIGIKEIPPFEIINTRRTVFK